MLLKGKFSFLRWTMQFVHHFSHYLAIKPNIKTVQTGVKRSKSRGVLPPTFHLGISIIPWKAEFLCSYSSSFMSCLNPSDLPFVNVSVWLRHVMTHTHTHHTNTHVMVLLPAATSSPAHGHVPTATPASIDYQRDGGWRARLSAGWLTTTTSLSLFLPEADL